MNPSISAVINTLNEEAWLPYALRSVKPWVDEIIVCDMASDDATVEVAEGYGATVLHRPRIGYVEPARAAAVASARGDWILVLDADEVVTPELSAYLRAVTFRDDIDVVAVPFANHLLGRRLRGTGWSPTQDRHLRFFRRGALTFPSAVHELPSVTPGTRVISPDPDTDGVIIHFNYTGVADFVDRLNRYTTIEASTAGPSHPLGAVLAGGREFFYRFFRARGFRDGWLGFHLAVLMAFYRYTARAKRHVAQVAGSEAAVDAGYRATADAALAAYEDPAVRCR